MREMEKEVYKKVRVNQQAMHYSRATSAVGMGGKQEVR